LLSVVQHTARDLTEVVALRSSAMTWPLEHLDELAPVQHSSVCISMQLKSIINHK